MASLTDTVNWYGRTFPVLSREGEELILAEDDAARFIALHAVYHVVRGLVLRRRKVTLPVVGGIVSVLVDGAADWIAGDRRMRSCDYLLEYADSRFGDIREIALLCESKRFRSLDVQFTGESRHGGEARTLGDVIASTVGGRAGTSLSPETVLWTDPDEDPAAGDRKGVTDGLRYDPDLDAYVRDDLIADRKRHVVVTRAEVDTGIFSYAGEALRDNERRLERLSPIRVRKITDRIVAPTKASRKRWRKSWRGTVPTAPAPGTSATPEARRAPRDVDRPLFDFAVNKMIEYQMPVKCLACRNLHACWSWMFSGYFQAGVTAPASCGGPFFGKVNE